GAGIVQDPRDPPPREGIFPPHPPFRGPGRRSDASGLVRPLVTKTDFGPPTESVDLPKTAVAGPHRLHRMPRSLLHLRAEEVARDLAPFAHSVPRKSWFQLGLGVTLFVVGW